MYECRASIDHLSKENATLRNVTRNQEKIIVDLDKEKTKLMQPETIMSTDQQINVLVAHVRKLNSVVTGHRETERQLNAENRLILLLELLSIATIIITITTTPIITITITPSLSITIYIITIVITSLLTEKNKKIVARNMRMQKKVNSWIKANRKRVAVEELRLQEKEKERMDAHGDGDGDGDGSGNDGDGDGDGDGDRIQMTTSQLFLGAAVAEEEVLDAGGSGSTSINNDQNSIISEAPIKRKRKKKQVNH